MEYKYDYDSVDEEIKMLASRGLKNKTSKELLTLLPDEDSVVRMLVAMQLCSHGSREVFEELVKLQNSPIGYMREASALILGQLGAPETPFIKESVPILLKLIKDEDFWVRSVSAFSLGMLCATDMPKDVEKALFQAAGDTRAEVRNQAAFSLGNASDSKETREILSALLQDASEEVRESAEMGLETLNENKSEGSRKSK